MFGNHFITNFPQNAPVKNFENRSIFHKDMDKTLWLTFVGPPCRSTIQSLQDTAKLSDTSVSLLTDVHKTLIFTYIGDRSI